MENRNAGTRHVITRRQALLGIAIASVLLLLVGSGVVLAGGNPFAKYPPGKASILQREQNEIATAQAHPHQKPTNPQPPASVPQATPVAGIMNDVHDGPFPACQFTVNNFWQGPVNGKWYLVYIGAEHFDPGTCGDSRGGLTIYSETVGQYGDGPIAFVGTYLAPTGTGITSVTATAVRGTTMTLQANTGATLTFDLSAAKFVPGS